MAHTKKQEHAKKHKNHKVQEAEDVGEATEEETLASIESILDEEGDGDIVYPIDEVFPQEEAPWVDELRANQHIMLEKLDKIETFLEYGERK